MSLVRPIYPDEQFLQHTPTVAALVCLFISMRREWLSNGSFACLVVFLWLHILGARYIYSYVPYDAWSERVWGISLSQWFTWERNHYDRIVHFCFGLLWLMPLREIAIRYAEASPRMAMVLALGAITTIGALYEIFEWAIAVVLAPHYAEAYNGQQGDFWDPQKDMALALLGSLIAALWVSVRSSPQQSY